MAAGPVLCVDLGNTRGKATLVEPGEEPRLLHAGDAGALVEAVQRALGSRAPWRVVVAAVCSPALAVEVEQALVAAFPSCAPVHPAHGLRLDVESPETVGADRLLAARGALELVGSSAIVVQVGTCVTVDAVTVPAVDEPGFRGQFLGGAIAPGPELLAEALERGGARLPRVAPDPEAAALGRDTPHALRAGIGVGLRGTIRELVLEVAREAGLESAPVVLTGGARAFARAGLVSLGRALHEDAHVVARGMAAELLRGAAS